MIKINTVLIIGAGANNPYGFPLGKKLIFDIINELSFVDTEKKIPNIKIKKQAFSDRYIPSNFMNLLLDIGMSIDMIEEFREALIKAKPPSIDEYLNINPDFNGIGKLSIARVIGKCESEDLIYNQDFKDDWYRFLWERMFKSSNKDNFIENNISFVTFNYDRSLEHYLYTCLKDTYRGFKDDEYNNILQKFGFIHIYGHLGFLPWQKPNEPRIEYGNVRSRGELLFAKNSIKLIDERILDSKLKDDLTKVFTNAKHIYFLGFGYDPSNMTILDGYIHLRIDFVRKGTVYGFSPNDINELKIRTSNHIILAKPENKILEFFGEFAVLN
jgi:hypothetical protein